MKKLTDPAVLASAGLLAVIGVAILDDMSRPGNATTDEVVSSFNRELARQPGPARPVTRGAIDEDVLYRTMNSIHWSGEPTVLLKAAETDSKGSHEAE